MELSANTDVDDLAGMVLPPCRHGNGPARGGLPGVGVMFTAV